MNLSKFSSKAQGLLGKMSEVTQELSEKAEQRTAERKEQKEKEKGLGRICHHKVKSNCEEIK